MKMTLRVLCLNLLLMLALIAISRRDYSGWIVYQYDAGANSQIFLMTGDGRLKRQLTRQPLCGSSPSWSSNGRWIAFVDQCAGSSPRVMRMQANGGNVQVISEVSRDFRTLKWSPDGRYIALSNAVYSDILVVDVERQTVTTFKLEHNRPFWSPDSQWLYARANDDEFTLYRFNVHTREEELVLSANNFFNDPQWSPDGANMLAGLSIEEGRGLFLLSADGSTRTPIPIDLPPDAPSDNLRSASWSPDGARIAFLSGHPMNYHIFIADADGGNLQQITENGRDRLNLQWSSNGEWLLYATDNITDPDFVRIRVDGSVTEELTHSGYNFSPDYAPITGKNWQPIWLIIAAAGLMLLSLMGHLRR